MPPPIAPGLRPRTQQLPEEGAAPPDPVVQAPPTIEPIQAQPPSTPPSLINPTSNPTAALPPAPKSVAPDRWSRLSREVLSTFKQLSSACHVQALRMTSEILRLASREASPADRPRLDRARALIELTLKIDDTWTPKMIGTALKRSVYPDSDAKWWTLNNQYMNTMFRALNVSMAANIPAAERAQGIGGALTRMGFGTRVSQDDILAGRLRPGAMVQIWYADDSLNTKTGEATYDKIMANKVKGGANGHSLFFVEYIRDGAGKPVGAVFRDQNGKSGLHEQLFDEAGWPLDSYGHASGYMVGTNISLEPPGES